VLRIETDAILICTTPVFPAKRKIHPRIVLAAEPGGDLDGNERTEAYSSALVARHSKSSL